MKVFKRILPLFFLIAAVGCAKRGSIDGGPKDTIPPVIVSSDPKNFNTNFTGSTIKIVFDEYVKMKDVSKQLVISPPMKTPPVILPNTASRFINVNIKDTLQPNTTYSFNFGQSITDNNEGNPLSQFRYVFSTGDYIDSLQLGGRIKDAFFKKTDNYVSVMLFEVGENYSDSIVFKGPPRYITNTLDSLKTWKLENLKPGKYRLIALKDNGNNKFDPKSDKIGFVKEFITIPNDTIYELELFSQAAGFRALKLSLSDGQKLVMGYEGDPKGLKVALKNGNEQLESIVTKVKDKDSVNIWFKPIKVDSLGVTVTKGDYTKEYFTRIKAQKKDTLKLESRMSGSTFPLNGKLKISASKPIVSFDNAKISVRNKDSVAVEFTTEYDEFERIISLDFKKEPTNKYTVQLLPGAVTDFYGDVNDTLKLSGSTKSLADYANIRVKLQNVRRFPIIVELTDEKGNAKATLYSTEKSELEFVSVEPTTYTLRVIYDDNGNQQWDTGDFMQLRQPEEVRYDPEPVIVKPNWDWEQVFSLP